MRGLLRTVPLSLLMAGRPLTEEEKREEELMTGDPLAPRPRGILWAFKEPPIREKRPPVPPHLYRGKR